MRLTVTDYTKIKSAISGLPPAYFALVMATGIVSIASYFLGFSFFAMSLLPLNIVFYVVLWALTISRLLLYPSRVLTDLNDHSSGVGFFTIVAATCVIGNQIVLLTKAYELGCFLLGLGAVLWVIIIYSVFTAFTIKAEKPPLEEGINGLWLVAVVATQSISILNSLVSNYFASFLEIFFFISLCLFLLGGLFYILIIILIFYRLMFFSMLPEALGPPYWINMGAVAISTLAGATIVLNSGGIMFLKELMPFVKGVTLLYWAIATWWIPLMLILEFWRSVIRHRGFSYNPQYWGMVFPLGMYTTCTYQLAKALNLDFLLIIPHYFIYIALLAWVLTFIGLLKKTIGTFISILTEKHEKTS
jgi:tellurite resistance protein TehA-like permease